MPKSTPRPFLIAALVPLVIAVALVTASRAKASRDPATASLHRAANAWIDSLDTGQKARAVRPFDEAARTAWHFVPKPTRKGVQLRDMTAAQEQAALALLRAAVSQDGYDKSLVIMSLEEILRRLEGSRGQNVRDQKRYFFTVFGTPTETGTWGLSIEGHHLSFNFTVRDGVIVDSTPQFMGANPARVKTTFTGMPEAGHQVLRDEEPLAFDLVRSLDATQKTKAVTGAAPKEIRGAGDPQPPQEPATGIAWRDLTPEQQKILRRLIEAYCGWMRPEVAEERLRLIESAAGGWNDLRFAWQGAVEPGVGHGYRIEGPTFLVEFVNVQPDAEGTPANHIHCVWRDKTGDFDLPPR